MTNILSDDEARVALGIGQQDASKVTLMQQANAAVTRVLEDRCGPVVYGTVTAEVHDGGGNRIYLKKRPVVEIVSVVEYDNTTAATLTAESNSSKPATGFYFNATSGALTRRDTNADVLYPVGRGNVVVTYVAGRYATQGSITDAWKTAAELTLKNAWRTWENSAAQLSEFEVPQASFPRFAVPNVVKELLGSEWQTGSGTGE